jgi:hypothetical protein
VFLHTHVSKKNADSKTVTDLPYLTTLGKNPCFLAVLWIRITLMRIRARIRLITLMRIRIRILILCGSGFLFDAHMDADPTFHPGADPDPEPSF